ncbi:hemerythrin domain-containing protein [Halobacteriovorax sp. HLS]|uniref:hemerythrin domain-containing protein n=1 Tax=Halobacteriovorax sp. HLS TaxID=2234000 RepID=UPI000FD8907A|nr:hemerythrin domain-containing protein [Halobacteriovorax sp. HLS]
MKEIINQLKDDHIRVNASLDKMEQLIDTPLETSRDELVSEFQFFKDFACKIHHKRESEVLYNWMKKQNPEADKEIIERINEEHKSLESEVNNFIEKITKMAKEEENTILCDIEQFIRVYKQHIEKEEKFIFLIAQQLTEKKTT